MSKLRLLVTPECNRRCRGCCNKDWDLKSLPVCRHFNGYDIIMLTGGEPMLYPILVKQLARRAKRQNPGRPVVMYTAKSDDVSAFLDVMGELHGVTLTLHTRKDVPNFVKLQAAIKAAGFKDKSLRLNVFHGISLKGVDTEGWKVKSGIKWLKNCPLPSDEVFMQL